MRKQNIAFYLLMMAVGVIYFWLYFVVPIWILSRDAYISDPESRPVSVQEQIMDETLIQGGFGGY